MVPPASSTVSSRLARWLKRLFRKMLETYGPIAVWLLALAAVLVLYSRRSNTGSVVAYGEERSITIAHLEPGMVRELRVELHQIVEPGELLAKMDDRADRLRLSTISKDLERLKYEVEAERSQIEMAQASADLDARDLARRLLVDRESAHIQHMVQIIERAGDQATLDGTLVEYNIMKRLYEEDQANFRELNLMKTQVDALRARVKTADEALERMKKAFKEADERWFAFTDAQQDPVDYESVLTPIRLAADVREREIRELVFRIDQYVIRSPARGQITAIYVEPGDRVLAGEPLVNISPTATNRVVAFLPPERSKFVYLGEPVRVFPVAATNEQSRQVQGAVLSVADAITEAPIRFRKMPSWPIWGREVIVTLSNDATLMPGEAVTLRFEE